MEIPTDPNPPDLTFPAYGCHSSSSDSSESLDPPPLSAPAPEPRGRFFVSEWCWVVVTPPATRLIDTIS